ncbi:glycosyltransferase [Candidatus Clostridium radicumherbarum]|uniref:glycosyltransferase n=1 Tax=Candidatus Clostridium radicumherbarum TaxID=3381662 RepID=UPI0038781B80
MFNKIAEDGLDFDLLIIGDRNIVEEFIKSNVDKCYLKVVVCKNVLQAIKIIFKRKYRVICFTDSRLLYLPILLISMVTRTKRLMIIASIKLSELEFENYIAKLVFNFTIKISKHIDVLYPSKVPMLRKVYPNKKFTTTPNSFTDLNKFIPNEKKNIISFVSRLVKDKNAKLFLESIVLCKEIIRERKYKVYLCGNGPEFSNLLKYVEDKNISDIVELKGYINPKDILPFSRIFMSLQINENYPSQSLLEAISSGCYIVASNKGDTKCIVKEQFGKLVELNEKSISKSIIDYIESSDNNKELVIQQARDFAIKNFDISISYKYFKNILLNLGEK